MERIDPKSQPPDKSPVLGSNRSNETGGGANFIPPEELERLQREVDQAKDDLEDNKFLARSIMAFDASDKYFNTSIRPRLNDSIKSYNNQHTSGSVFAMDGDPSNNKIFRPKTRTILRKYGAAAAASFFSNLDAVSIEAENASDKAEVLSAAITKALVNYRLRKFIPWYQICLGGFNDALVQGLVCGHVYWEAQEGEDGELKGETPAIELVALENLRFDPAADWTDIVNSTPYLIILKPMYIGDLKDKMRKGIFLELSDGEIASSYNPDNSETVKERNNNADPFKSDGGLPNDYQTVIVQFHIHRIDGEDWVWYTLNNTAMLTDPQPLKEVYFHGKRPFIIGSYDIESHQAYVTPLPELLQPTQEEMNILANQRRTNVDMAMNRKFRVSPEAGDQFDPMALLSNEVGSIVFAKKDDIEALDVPDVTQSSYQEQILLDKDFDELAGNYSPQPSVVASNPQETHRFHQMLNQNANVIVEQAIKTYALTFIEPLLRQLVLLEQHYETDETVVGLVGQQAGLFQKFGGQMLWTVDAHKLVRQAPPPQQPGAQPAQQPQAPQGAAPAPGGGQAPQPGQPPQAAPQPPPNPVPSQALPPGVSIENLLKRELTIRVNVGLNATDPEKKLAKFISALQTVLALSANPLHGAFDMEEVGNEIFALSGYGDGKRFLNADTNPQVVALQQQIMALTQKLNNKMIEPQTKLAIAQANIKSHEKIEAAKLKHDATELQAENMRFAVEHSHDMAQHLNPSPEPPPTT